MQNRPLEDTQFTKYTTQTIKDTPIEHAGPYNWSGKVPKAVYMSKLGVHITRLITSSHMELTKRQNQ